MARAGRCSCCGVQCTGLRAELLRCPLCDICDHKHGDALQVHCVALVRSGQITPHHAIARMMLDDANMAGMLALRHSPTLEQPLACEVIVPVPVPRWRVVMGRARARGELPEIELMIHATLARYLGCPTTRGAIDAIARDLTEMLTTVDPNVVSVEVDSKRDVLDPHHLMISIKTRTGVAPGMVQISAHASDAEIPHDIMSRPRGQA